MNRQRAGLWVLFLSGLWMTAPSAGPAPTSMSTGRRLLGPIAQVAAAWQWVRVRVALDAGRSGLAMARAEIALELDPQATGGWKFLASTLAFDRASPDREPDPDLREEWTRVALDLLRRGEQSAAHPAELALQRGIILVHAGDSEGRIPWPGGAAGAWSEAQQAFLRAATLDPTSTEPWAHQAANRCLRLGSPEIAPEFGQRKQALEQALAFLDRGLELVHSPAALHFQRGMLLAFIAESPDGERYSGGKNALYTEAIDAFARAEAENFPLARVGKEGAQEALAELHGR
ncbi:MAG: tetratricopeptide (TPR) repeat protein [Candidatus Paceibacteria bacterium]|jgi:tetratricopeptide (TPR) repeat protein